MIDSSVFLSHDQIPIGARNLGGKLIAYVLDMPNAEAESLLAHGGRLFPAQLHALQSLGGLFEVAKQQRMHNQVLQWSDVHSLTGIRFQGSDINPFGHLRSMHAGKHRIADTDDAVFNALAPMAVDAFPFFLLPRPGDMFGFDHPQIPHFFGDPRQKVFQSAVMDDPGLSKLFPTPGTDDISTVGHYYTSTGRGRGIQLTLLADVLMRAAREWMLASAGASIDCYMEACKRVIVTLRSACAGGRARVPALILFGGASPPSNASAQHTFGKLQSIPASLIEILPSSARPSTGGDAGNLTFGFMLATEIDYKLSLTGASELQSGVPSPWPVEMKSLELLAKQADTLVLAASLAMERHPPVAVTHLATAVLDPLVRLNVRWGKRQMSPLGVWKCTDDEFASIARWGQLIELGLHDRIRAPIRRTLSALTSRDDPMDSFVDAVIALDGLFGTGAQVSFSVPASISRLVSRSKKDRDTTFSDAKRLYDMRSRLVHGDEVPSGAAISSHRDQALDLLLKCLRVLFESMPELIEMKASDRAKSILLGDLPENGSGA